MTCHVLVWDLDANKEIVTLAGLEKGVLKTPMATRIIEDALSHLLGPLILTDDLRIMRQGVYDTTVALCELTPNDTNQRARYIKELQERKA